MHETPVLSALKPRDSQSLTEPGERREAASGEPVPGKSAAMTTELLDTVPVVRSGEVLQQTPQEGQLFEACPACGSLMDVTSQEPFAKVHCPSCGQALRARKQFNHYKLLELIGQGGMGNVFKAMDCNLNRLVALKVLRKEFASKPDEIDKLADEARMTASITHPHVVKVFGFGQDHGQFYMAMELVEKGSLDDLLALQRRVPEVQVLEVGIQIAQGLEAALDHGLLHRDIKPGNILFADAHTSKLVDFGLAIVMDEAAAAVGEIWGTPYYIAPEKLDNQPEDFRSDVYSLGGTLFHALAGRPPYEADTASMVALKQLKSQPVSLQAFAPEVSSETSYVINRMLAKNPDDRYSSYSELAEHLGYARTKLLERIKRPPQPKARVVVEDAKTRRFTGILSLALLGVAVLGGLTVFAFRDQLFPAVAKQAAPAFSEQDFDREFARAVTLLSERRWEEAIAAFSDLAAIPEATQPRASWAKMNLGLAQLFGGQEPAASKTFRAINQAGMFANEGPNIEYADFFVEASRLLATPGKKIEPATARLFNASNFESFAILAFAAKNWELGRPGDALGLLRSFSRLRTLPTDAWIGQYRDLAKLYLADAEAIDAARRAVEKATTPDERKQAAKAIHEARQKVQTGDRASEALDRLGDQLGTAP